MSKRVLSLVLALVMVLGTFSTVFAAESGNAKVDWLVEEGLVVGDAGTGDLRLADPIKRSEVAVMVTKALDLEAVANASAAFPSIFKDMSPAHWANGFVNTAAGRGFISGYPNGNFVPDNNVNYAEMASMLVRTIPGAMTAEEQANAVWPTTWLAKAAELGLFDDVAVADYNAPATRENVFNMVYNAVINHQAGNYTIVKAIVLENYRVEKLNKDEVVVEIIEEVQRAKFVEESRKDMRGEQLSLTIPAKVEDVENLLGRVANFTLDKDGKVVNVKVDESYKVVTGALKATKSKMGSYTVELPERYKASESDERIFRTYFNNKGYAYEDFYQDPTTKDREDDFTADYAKITTKNGKVLFIDAFTFDDIAPVKEVKKDGAEVYAYNDARDGGIKKFELKDSTKVITVEDGVFNIGSREDIAANDVIHEFGGNFIVRKDAQVDGTYNKVSIDRDKDTYVHIDDEEYYVPEATSKKPVYAYDSKEFLTLEASNADRVLREFKGEKVTALLDISDNLQYIGSEIELGEFVALLSNVLAKDIKVVKNNNDKAEYTVTFDSTLEVGGSTRYQNLDKFDKGDLVYLSVDDTEVDTMIQLVKADVEGTLVQQDSKDKYMISTNSITLDKEYKVLDRTNVFIRSGNTLKGTTIEDVKKAQDNSEDLKAYVLTDKAYADLVKDARRDVSDRTDVAHTIIFTKVTNTVSYDKEVAEIVRTYTAGRDVELDVKFAGNSEVVTRVVERDSKAYDDIKAKKVNIGDVVELSITKDDDKIVKEVKLLIEEDADVYEVYSISSRTGYREIVLEGTGGKEDRKQFWLDRDADIFGNLEEGTKVSYYSSNESKDNPDIEVIYVEGTKAKVTGTFLTDDPVPPAEPVTYIIDEYRAPFARLTLEDVDGVKTNFLVGSFDAWFIGDLEVDEDVMKAWLGKAANLAGDVYVDVTEDNELVVDAVYSAEIDEITAVAANYDVDYADDLTAETALAALPATTTITDEYGIEYTVDLTWTFDAAFDGDAEAVNPATGRFTLPSGVAQTDPATDLNVTATVTIGADE